VSVYHPYVCFGSAVHSQHWNCENAWGLFLPTNFPDSKMLINLPKLSTLQSKGWYILRKNREFCSLSQGCENKNKVCSGQDISYYTRNSSAEHLGSPQRACPQQHTSRGMLSILRDVCCCGRHTFRAGGKRINHAHFKLTNHTIVLGHGTRTKFGQDDLARTSCENSRTRAVRTKWRHSVLAALGERTQFSVLAVYVSALRGQTWSEI